MLRQDNVPRLGTAGATMWGSEWKLERMMPGELASQQFYRFVREERLFCATLAHLLMQRGPNLRNFLTLVNDRFPEGSNLPLTQLEEAQIYLEFTFLRDSWNSLGKSNDEKRERIFTLLSRVPGLGHYKSECFPGTIPEFNAFFMGPHGARIASDIVYPGRWSVSTLFERFGKDPEEFRNFCRFKWSFNIKPDMVVLLAGSQPLCIEAKLESREGWYPSSAQECAIFDSLFRKGERRVGQIGLQQFMFEHLLASPCQTILIGRTAPVADDDESVLFLYWKEVFQELDFDASIPFVLCGSLLKKTAIYTQGEKALTSEPRSPRVAISCLVHRSVLEAADEPVRPPAG